MKIDVSNIAKLANLSLKKDDVKKYEEQLSSILDYIEKLKEVNTQNTPETSQITNLENVFREDKAEKSLSQTDALSNTKSKENGFFKVDAILEE